MSPPQRPLVSIYFRMYGPYILARVNAAAERLNVVGIEGSRRSAVYRWEPQVGGERFTRRTLFTDQAIERLASREKIAASRAALDAVDPDVVCIGGWSSTEALTMLDWARRRGRRVVLFSESTWHDARRRGWREWLKKHVVRLVDAALVGGEAQRAYVETLGMPRERVFIGYDAVDNGYFATGAEKARADAAAVRTRLELPEHYFLAASRFIAKKNMARLVEAYAAYRKHAGAAAWDLVLVGDGELRDALEAQVEALGLSGAVHFKGFRQYDEMPAFYGLADAFVHVSTVEQWGLVVNEAMAAGLPVIVSRNCGCATDLIEQGVNGWLVDPFDVDDIAGRMIEVAAPATDRAALADRARARVADYGPDRFGQGLADAVAACIATPPRRSDAISRLVIRLLALRSTPGGA